MLYQKPDDNEIEISIFGPGYGECIVIHAGFNDWMIVDSCIDQVKRPAGLEYLDKLGVDVKHDVKIVVATHWHDDHIRGLSDVVQSCENALFVCSSALRFEEFRILVALCGRKRIDQNSGSGVKEFFQILTTIRKRIESISPPEPLSWAISGRCLWRSLDRDPQHKFEVFSLSPSDFSVTMSKVEIAKIMPQRGDNDKNIISMSPNHTAVVLWLICLCL